MVYLLYALFSSTSSSLLIWLKGLHGGTVVTILDIWESLLWFDVLGEIGRDLKEIEFYINCEKDTSFILNFT